MVSKKKKTFNEMSYREVQCANTKNRSKLSKDDQQWLKGNHYKNVGWGNVISLYQKIEELLDKSQLEDLTLEDLFLEADRIGNKYQSTQEIQEFNQQLAKEVNEVSEAIDRQFPDTEIEVIDFGDSNHRPRKSRNPKTSRTVKL
jgi:nucleoid DNA-binding protein